MNYYGPREIANKDGNGTGKWRYTKRNDDRIWAVGYCAEDCPGRDTPEEAREHFRQWEIDTAREITVAWPGNACRVCGALTIGGFEVGHTSLYLLCDQHRTREHLAPLVPASDAISSW